MASRTSPERKRIQDAPGRPLMPRLAATAQTNTNRSTPPPRLAGYVPPSKTPPLRKPLATNSPNLKSSPYTATNTPVKSIEDSNVTPRSSARRNRASSARSTPGTPQNVTPTTVRPKSMASPSNLASNGVSTPSGTATRALNGANAQQQRPQINGTTSTNPRMSPPHKRKSMSLSPTQEGGFFYASTMKLSNGAQREALALSRNVGGKGESPVSGLGSAKAPFANSSKLLRAPLKSASAPISQVNGSSSAPSTLIKAASPTLTPSNTQPPPPLQRPASPPKNGFHLSYRKGASQVSLTNSPFPFSPTLIAQQSPDAIKPGHSRQQSSLDSDSDRLSQLTNGHSATFSSPSSPQKASPRILRRSIDTKLDTSISSEPENGSPVLRSPSSIVGISNGPDLAANARRERKVLDLEISNSSLLAINKGLEREVYKLKAENRRFRRITRHTDRSISMVSDDPSLASMSQLSGLTEDYDDDESESPQNRPSGLYSQLNPDTDEEASMSTETMEQSDTRHRTADQKRVQLDLSKHKQLILESQQMNQSLRRCLLISEQLISDGNKALEYRAPVVESNLGGRVLSPDEQEQYLEYGTYKTRTGDYFNIHEDGSTEPSDPRLAMANGIAQTIEKQPDLSEDVDVLDRLRVISDPNLSVSQDMF